MRESDNSNEKKSTEDKILAAAEREFMAKGFSAARTTSIAEAAGVTHAMLHYYFRTKELLFNKIVNGKLNLLAELALATMAESDLPLFEKLKVFIERHIDFIAGHLELPIFFITELRINPDRMQGLISHIQPTVKKVVKLLQNDIDRCASQGQCRRVDARSIIIDILSLDIFPFMASPMVSRLLAPVMDDMAAFIAQRKKDIYEIIMKRLIP